MAGFIVFVSRPHIRYVQLKYSQENRGLCRPKLEVAFKGRASIEAHLYLESDASKAPSRTTLAPLHRRGVTGFSHPLTRGQPFRAFVQAIGTCGRAWWMCVAETWKDSRELQVCMQYPLSLEYLIYCRIDSVTTMSRHRRTVAIFDVTLPPAGIHCIRHSYVYVQLECLAQNSGVVVRDPGVGF